MVGGDLDAGGKAASKALGGLTGANTRTGDMVFAGGAAADGPAPALDGAEVAASSKALHPSPEGAAEGAANPQAALASPFCEAGKALLAVGSVAGFGVTPAPNGDQASPLPAAA